MCDYIYLDGSSATVDGDYLLNWYIDERYLRNKKENQKIFVSVQQIAFETIFISLEDEQAIVTQIELITNLNLKNCYNTKGKYKVLTLCDSSDTIFTNGANVKNEIIKTTTCNNNYYMIFETDMPSQIQMGALIYNDSVQFDDTNKEYFKCMLCMLKFEYQDK